MATSLASTAAMCTPPDCVCESVSESVDTMLLGGGGAVLTCLLAEEGRHLWFQDIKMHGLLLLMAKRLDFIIFDNDSHQATCDHARS